MRKRLSRGFFVAVICCCTAMVFAAPSQCAVCERALSHRYYTYQGASCCSQACANELHPSCFVCQKSVSKQYISANGAAFCSKDCFNTTLPECKLCNSPFEKGYSITKHKYCSTCVDENPKCFSCGLPAAYPTQLLDGRDICDHCMRWSVKTQKMALVHYDRARRNLEAWTSLKIHTLPELELINREEMHRRSKKLRKSDSPVSIRGLYSRQAWIVTRRSIFGFKKEEPPEEKERIFIVNHLHDEVFRTAAVHELMHDLIYEHFPRLADAPLWVHEGICQRAAAEYCRRRNYIDILHGIENCKDPDYGDGYRYINAITGFEGWRALKRWMENVDVDTLPKKAPK